LLFGNEAPDFLSGLASLCFAVFPLVGVDAQGGIGFAVSEPALHVDDGEVERDQHAGVRVAEIVQGWLWGGELGGLGGAFEDPKLFGPLNKADFRLSHPGNIETHAIIRRG
jgi:hypothetical protein